MIWKSTVSHMYLPGMFFSPPTFALSPKFVSCHRYRLIPLFPPILSHSPLVDYARRTKLFFSSIGRDYRLLAAKAPRNPSSGNAGEKTLASSEIRRVNGQEEGRGEKGRVCSGIERQNARERRKIRERN